MLNAEDTARGQEEFDLLQIQKAYLDTLLKGNIPDLPENGDPLIAAIVDPSPNQVAVLECIDKFSTLINQLGEMRGFMTELCKGNLDADVPGRRNYLAAPLKELHTQLSSLAWSMAQLAKGNVVSRLYYRGTLFESFNSLIEKVASVSSQLDTVRTKQEPKWDWNVNSWRYHQILSALNNLRIMVLEVSTDGKIVYANRPAKEYFGGIEYLSIAPENARTATSVLEQYLVQVAHDAKNDTFPRFREIYDEPNNCWYKITSDRVHFSDTRMGYLHMVDNISEWKKHESNLKQAATTDSLTGIFNRGYGLQALEEALFASKGGIPCCAAFIDLDGLKMINDVFGHNSGDHALRTIAQVLTTSVRDNRDVVSRFGGDEFVIVFKNCTEALAHRAMDRMHDKLNELNKNSSVEYEMGFSHGITAIDGARDNSLQEIIERMDQIMYAIKAEKKRERAGGAAAGCT